MVVFFFSPVVEAVCRQNKLKEAVLLPNGLLLTESDISYSSREEGVLFPARIRASEACSSCRGVKLIR